MSRRRDFNMGEKIAILHLRVLELEGRPVPFATQGRLSAEEIRGWYDWDHYPIRHIDGGTTHPSNGQALLNALGAAFLGQLNEHGIKTATRDIPEIAKAKRVRKGHEEFRRRLLARSEGRAEEQPARHDQSRWAKRKMQGWRRFDGTPVRAKP